MKLTQIPKIGEITDQSGMKLLLSSSDGNFSQGENDVQSICATGDGKVEFINFSDHSLALVNSELGCPAYYSVPAVEENKVLSSEQPPKAVLMDLDGTTIHSEEFWIWIIEKTTASLLDNKGFSLEEADIPYVSGHSVSEHLSHCVAKYCPDKSLEEARAFYFHHTHHEMSEIMAGRGRKGAFTPSPGIKDFLHGLKANDIKIGLVTSGLYEKAWPEILNGFETLGMGDPLEFYDSIITAGYPLRAGASGTLGELSPKPHPWLYSEVALVGLGLKPKDLSQVVGIEDSGAGVCSVRLAGLVTIGITGGNIESSGTKELCHLYADSFEQIAQKISVSQLV
ncbi:MAG: HAD family phosphatase [Planctomycetes bacterium]|nr:HAD family phosphatase [Planctomycetota bacterium]